MTAKLRFDWQATDLGMQGGLPFQRTEWEDVLAVEWDEAKVYARRQAEFMLPRHVSEVENLQGIVLVEFAEPGIPFRMCSFTLE